MLFAMKVFDPLSLASVEGRTFTTSSLPITVPEKVASDTLIVTVSVASEVLTFPNKKLKLLSVTFEKIEGDGVLMKCPSAAMTGEYWFTEKTESSASGNILESSSTSKTFLSILRPRLRPCVPILSSRHLPFGQPF